MDTLSVRDQMIDFELRHSEMARASGRRHGEPGMRQAVRRFGRLLVGLGEALVAGGRKLETGRVPQARVAVPHRLAR